MDDDADQENEERILKERGEMRDATRQKCLPSLEFGVEKDANGEIDSCLETVMVISPFLKFRLYNLFARLGIVMCMIA